MPNLMIASVATAGNQVTIQGSTVANVAVTATDSNGTSLGTTTSNATTGAFSISVTSLATGGVTIKAAGKMVLDTQISMSTIVHAPAAPVVAGH